MPRSEFDDTNPYLRSIEEERGYSVVAFLKARGLGGLLGDGLVPYLRKPSVAEEVMKELLILGQNGCIAVEQQTKVTIAKIFANAALALPKTCGEILMPDQIALRRRFLEGEEKLGDISLQSAFERYKAGDIR